MKSNKTKQTNNLFAILIVLIFLISAIGLLKNTKQSLISSSSKKQITQPARTSDTLEPVKWEKIDQGEFKNTYIGERIEKGRTYYSDSAMNFIAGYDEFSDGEISFLHHKSDEVITTSKDKFISEVGELENTIKTIELENYGLLFRVSTTAFRDVVDYETTHTPIQGNTIKSVKKKDVIAFGIPSVELESIETDFGYDRRVLIVPKNGKTYIFYSLIDSVNGEVTSTDVIMTTFEFVEYQK